MGSDERRQNKYLRRAAGGVQEVAGPLRILRCPGLLVRDGWGDVRSRQVDRQKPQVIRRSRTLRSLAGEAVH